MVRSVAGTLFATLVCAACSGARPPVPAGTVSGGAAVLVYLDGRAEPSPSRGPRATAVVAVRQDEAETPLRLESRGRCPDELQEQRLLAWGGLGPGQYRGLRVALAPEPGRDEGPTFQFVELPFAIADETMTVLLLSPAADGAAVPFHGVLPARPAAGVLAAAASRGANAVLLFDKQTGRVAGALPAHSQPTALAGGPERRRAYATLAGDDAVMAFDLFEGRLLERVPMRIGDRPADLVVSADGGTLLVVNEGSGTLAFLDAGSLREIDRITVGTRPNDIALGPGGRRAVVVNTGSASLSIVDVAGHTVDGTVTTDPGPWRACWDRRGERIFLAQRDSVHLLVVDPQRPAVVDRIEVGLGVTALAVNPANNLLYVARRGSGRVDVFDPRIRSRVESIPIADDVGMLEFDAEQGALYFTLPRAGQVGAVRVIGQAPLFRLDTGPDPVAILVPER